MNCAAPDGASIGATAASPAASAKPRGLSPVRAPCKQADASPQALRTFLKQRLHSPRLHGSAIERSFLPALGFDPVIANPVGNATS
jgi:hypothetical protein